jgi:hypothetical protein
MTRIEQPHHSIRWRRGEPSIEWAQSPRRSLELRRAARVRPRGRRQRTVLCHTSHARDAFHIVHHHPPSSSLAGFPVWPRPTVPRAVAPGSGAVPIASIAGPIGPGSANRPSCPFARVSSRCSYNTTSLHTHSVAARPRAPRRDASDVADEHRRPIHGVGVLGRAHARWARPPTDLTRSGAFGRPRTNHTWAGEGSWTAWGAGAQHVPCRTAQDDRRPDRGAGGRCRATGSRAAPDTPTRASLTNAQAYDERYSERLVAGG